MKYGYTICYVKDVAQTIEFYKQAFGFTRKFVAPGNEYAELNSGETTIAFASIELAMSSLKQRFIESSVTAQPLGIELGFTTETIEEDFERAIKAGAVEVHSIVDKPWGQRVGYVRDMNGFLIEICTPMKS